VFDGRTFGRPLSNAAKELECADAAKCILGVQPLQTRREDQGAAVLDRQIDNVVIVDRQLDVDAAFRGKAAIYCNPVGGNSSSSTPWM
jgi:hypothetical protein